jgi:hypothetical protein
LADSASAEARMSETPIADMIEKMLAENVSRETILLAVRTVELSLTTVVRQSSDKDDRRRERDRLWHQETRVKQRNSKHVAKANDVANVVTMSSATEDDNAKNPCELSFLLTESPSGIQEVRKKKTAVVVEGRRGSRLTAGLVLSDQDRAFALDHGVKNPQTLWAEFVDYWIAIPGSRGTKTNWPATWRNRVRAVTAGRPNGTRRQTLGDLATELADEARELEHAAGIGRPPAAVRGD